MKLSTKSRYGLRAMVDLALRYKAGPTTVKGISKRENISTQYLEQILNRLRKNGMVKSIRGPKGGYVLAKSPGMIKIGDVVKILEGDISPVDCTSKKKVCARIDRCVTKIVWDKLASSIEKTLYSITLSDLLKEAKERGIDKRIEHDYTFHI